MNAVCDMANAWPISDISLHHHQYGQFSTERLLHLLNAGQPMQVRARNGTQNNSKATTTLTVRENALKARTRQVAADVTSEAAAIPSAS